MKISERLVEIREKYGYTCKRLSDELDKPYAAITKYENGEREVNSEYLVEIAKKFKAIPHNRTRAISTKRRSFHCAVLPKTREPAKEELIAALMLLHVIQNPAETLSDADMQFLTNIVALLNDWFGRPETPVKSPQLGDTLSPTSNTPQKQLKTVFWHFGNSAHQTQ